MKKEKDTDGCALLELTVLARTSD
ncbi:hypothetical protein ALC60_11348 [Trachymyrmex zeteki]|uniref:Uncharacterized protein n=1 Tax=Mycetomoellerius zeteki TaxID=64791 RepID=A0A151WNX1_9HYME|nr:hypothetical protein ALC60_11348 [Trachymyrmex zeteki]